MTSAPAPAPRRLDQGRPDWERIGLAVATVVVFGVAFVAFRHRQLWLDEAYTWYVVKLTNAQGWHFAFGPRGEFNMSLYYLLMRLFTPSSGTAFWMRLPSLVAMIATVPLVWMLGGRVHPGRFVRCAATGLFLTAPYIVYYAFDARAYGLLTLFTVGSSLLLVLALEGRRAAVVAYVVLLPVGVALDLLATYVIAAHVLALVLITSGSRWTRVKRALSLTWLGLVVGLGAALVGLRQRQLIDRAPVSLNSLAHDAYNLTGHAGPLSVILIIALAWGAYAAFVERPLRPAAVIAVLTATVPIGLALVLSSSRPQIAIDYQLNTIPMLCIVAAAGLRWGLPDRRVRLAAIGVCLVLGVAGQLYLYRTPNIERPQDVAAYIQAHSRPGDELTYLSVYAAMPVGRYVQVDGYHVPPVVGAVPDLTRITAAVTHVPLDRAVASLAPGSTLWVVLRATSDVNQVSVASVMDKLGLRYLDRVSFGNYTIERWQPRQ